MNADIDKMTEFYVQEILSSARKYIERDELLLRRIIRSLLDQYSVKREIEEKRHVQSQ